MRKYKVGDRIVDAHTGLGTIIGICANTYDYLVEYDGLTTGHDGRLNWIKLTDGRLPKKGSGSCFFVREFNIKPTKETKFKNLMEAYEKIQGGG